VRNKWFNAIKGFESLGDPDRDFDNIANAKRERDLARCACDRFYADQAAAAAGFVTLSALAPGECDVANDTEPVCAIAFRTCP
jgi:hypothetical protein